MIKSLMTCGRTEIPATTRDAVAAAGMMLAATFLFTALALVARRNGWVLVADVTKDFGFLAALTLSLPFWLIKGQPREERVLIVCVTLAGLVAIALQP